MKKLLSITLAITFLLSTMVFVPATANADSKPPSTSITSLSAGVKSFTVKWKKKSVNGYQIQYSTNSKFNNSKKVTIKKGTTTSKTVKSLNGKKKYYVRVRAFKVKNNKNVYSSWSEKKSVTTKSESKKSSTKKSTVNKTGSVVYTTPTGKKYHYSKSCAGKNAIKTTLKEAKKTYDPCKKCAS